MSKKVKPDPDYPDHHDPDTCECPKCAEQPDAGKLSVIQFILHNKKHIVVGYLRLKDGWTQFAKRAEWGKELYWVYPCPFKWHHWHCDRLDRQEAWIKLITSNYEKRGEMVLRLDKQVTELRTQLTATSSLKLKASLETPPSELVAKDEEIERLRVGLEQPKCKTCGDTKIAKVPNGRGGTKLVAPCPDCAEQPEAGPRPLEGETRSRLLGIMRAKDINDAIVKYGELRTQLAAKDTGNKQLQAKVQHTIDCCKARVEVGGMSISAAVAITGLSRKEIEDWLVEKQLKESGHI